MSNLPSLSNVETEHIYDEWKVTPLRMWVERHGLAVVFILTLFNILQSWPYTERYFFFIAHAAICFYEIDVYHYARSLKSKAYILTIEETRRYVLLTCLCFFTDVFTLAVQVRDYQSSSTTDNLVKMILLICLSFITLIRFCESFVRQRMCSHLPFYLSNPHSFNKSLYYCSTSIGQMYPNLIRKNI